MTSSPPLPAVVPIARPSVRSLVRAVAATGIAAFDRAKAGSIVASNWRADDGAKWLVERAAVPPTSIADAPGIVQTVMPDFVTTLATASAAAKIFKDGLILSFGRAGQINVPTLLGDPTYAAFVAEGGGIPVAQGKIEPLVSLTPHKLSVIMVMTQEMVRSSNVEALVRDSLIRSAGLTLDAVLFDDQPASAARPAGLRYNVAALTASSAANKADALLDDIETLHLDLEAVTPQHPGIYVMSPTRALMAELRSPHGLDPLIVIGSYAFHGSKILAAVAPNAIVSVFGDAPEIDVSAESALQMDTMPGATGTPSASIWQKDSIAVRLRIPVTWALRSDAGLAWLTATGW